MISGVISVSGKPTIGAAGGESALKSKNSVGRLDLGYAGAVEGESN